jgi:alginate O-acetyltransferase complex protein AlgI
LVGEDAMLFCSQQFVLFFLAVFSVYWLIPSHRVRIGILLLASFFFYRSWNEMLVWLVVGTSTLDYLIARRIDASSRLWERRLLLTVTICSNLGVLCYFKYANFFLRSLEDSLRAAGVERSLPVLAVILPIGISFYTFEAISYVVDVYRRTIPAERNLAHFLLFILFFPHLIAGPIVRGRDFLPQVRRPRSWSWPRAHLGLRLFLLGMVKKLAIGDRMALLADPVFAAPGEFRTSVLWLAALAYAIQVYCDFSGYTDMARGCAHLLGYSLAENFHLPYLAPNIAEFWRRWHISLSSWLRDYLFIPLGGSRGTRWQTWRNLIAVMVLGGLWHGAAWNYVLFGLGMGLWLCLHRAFRDWAVGRPGLDRALQTSAGTCLRVALTFLCFVCLLTVFRSPTLTSGATFLNRMFLTGIGRTEPFNSTCIAVLAGLVALGYYLAYQGRWEKWLRAVHPAVQGTAYALTMTVTLVLAPGDGKLFIYFIF